MSRRLKPLAARRGYHKPCRWQRRRMDYAAREITRYTDWLGEGDTRIGDLGLQQEIIDNLPMWIDELAYFGVHVRLTRRVRDFLDTATHWRFSPRGAS